MGVRSWSASRLAHIEKPRGAGAGAEVLVRAADRQVHPAGIKVDRYGTHGVAEVPQRQRPGGVGVGGQGGDVEELSGPIVDVRPGHQRDVVAERTIVEANAAAELLGHRGKDVRVRGELVVGRHE